MDVPSEGKIYFGDEVITDYNSDQLALFRRKHCGFVFQQRCLIDSMSIMDNVLAAGLLVQKDKKALVEKANNLFDLVEVQPHTRSKFPSQVSGGRAQRVGIVRALINSPEILFADEPTGALNSKTSIEVLDTFSKFNRDGQSIIMVTHDMQTALRGNRILYFKDGNIKGEFNLQSTMVMTLKEEMTLRCFLKRWNGKKKWYKSCTTFFINQFVFILYDVQLYLCTLQLS